MRILSMAVALTALTTVQARAQDPTVVDSTHYTVVLENDQVRVLRITYGPHEKSVMHYHPAGVAVFLTNQHGKFTFPDGQTTEWEAKPGDAIWAEDGAHLPENLTGDRIEVILVELKTPTGGGR